jgi:broad specificity phosphatase PhoE
VTRTIVHLMRHGEVHNPTGILYGRLPGFRLSAQGEKQALRVAEHLADRDIVHVVASPLERAQQTAGPIADSHRLELATDDRLIEADNQFEGLKVSVGDGALRSPKHWPKLRNPFEPSWGEPYLKIAHRMLGAVHRARAAAAGHEAVCVSHQLPVWTVRLFLEGKHMWHDPRKRQCSLASLTTLTFEDEQLIRISYSEPAGSTDPRVTGA